MGKGRCTSLSRRFVFVALNLSLPPRSSPHTMSSLKHHPSLPAPVLSAGANLKAKSSVLTGVQDAYWSDEEVRLLFFFLCLHLCPYQLCHDLSPLQEAKECPLCLEEMDISDLNFKPCQCEYQVPNPPFFLSFLSLKHSIVL